MILFQAVIQGSWLLPAVKSYGLLQIWSQPDQGKRDGAQHRRIDFQAWKLWILFPLTWFLAMPSCKGSSASVQEERGMDFCGRSFLHMSFKLSCLKKNSFGAIDSQVSKWQMVTVKLRTWTVETYLSINSGSGAY